MLFKVALVNGSSFIYENEEINTISEMSKIMNEKNQHLPNSNIKIRDIIYVTELSADNEISANISKITSLSEELAFNRSKSMKSGEGYIVPVHVAVELYSLTGAIKDIRLDGVKEHLLKLI